jgi:four helix bundle protein
MVGALPRNRIADVFAGQLVRSSTSVAANYRAACRGRSHAEFIAKIGVVEEEADESVFWIELSAEAGLTKPQRVSDLASEGREILAIVTASRKTAKRRQRATKEGPKLPRRAQSQPPGLQ